ncbi:MAG: hypothetical protein JNM56_15350, partial [Planctomycetia bacterium]|nr:hypothetical protein [Planctomycetia bacterium]
IGRSNGQYEGKVQTIKKALSSIDQDEVLIKGSVQTAQKNAKEAANILAKGKQTLDLLVSKVKKLRDDLEFFKMDYGKHIKEFESSCENWTERLADVYKDPKSSIQEKAKSRDRIIKLATELGDKVPNWQKEVEQSTKEYHQRWQECPRKVCMSSKFPAHADVQALLLALLELQKAGATAVRLQLLVNQLVDKAKTYGEQK